MLTLLFLPGMDNSGTGHWQTLWEADFSKEPNWNGRKLASKRVVQNDRLTPTLKQWTERLAWEMDHAQGRVILVGHSLGCVLAAHFGMNCMKNIEAARWLGHFSLPRLMLKNNIRKGCTKFRIRSNPCLWGRYNPHGVFMSWQAKMIPIAISNGHDCLPNAGERKRHFIISEPLGTSTTQ
ncbi:MAG: serine hydrolase family protein [Magnetococcales bacterium]|nr:serine hydrolase family protein [Magnetococcales bacterium]